MSSVTRTRSWLIAAVLMLATDGYLVANTPFDEDELATHLPWVQEQVNWMTRLKNERDRQVYRLMGFVQEADTFSDRRLRDMLKTTAMRTLGVIQAHQASDLLITEILYRPVSWPSDHRDAPFYAFPAAQALVNIGSSVVPHLLAQAAREELTPKEHELYAWVIFGVYGYRQSDSALLRLERELKKYQHVGVSTSARNIEEIIRYYKTADGNDRRTWPSKTGFRRQPETTAEVQE